MFWGIVIATFGNLSNSLGLVIQRKALSNENENNALWAIGVCVNAIGEIFNVIAYGYSPGFVVAPIGAVTVCSTPIFAHVCMKERVRVQDVVGVV